MDRNSPRLAPQTGERTADNRGQVATQEVALNRTPSVAASPPLEEAPVQPIVWRASSQGLTGTSTEDCSPVVSVNWRSCVKESAVPPVVDNLPKELVKVTMPPYVIEPPDVLFVRLPKALPRPPYHLQPLDEVQVQAPLQELLPNEPHPRCLHVGSPGAHRPVLFLRQGPDRRPDHGRGSGGHSEISDEELEAASRGRDAASHPELRVPAGGIPGTDGWHPEAWDPTEIFTSPARPWPRPSTRSRPTWRGRCCVPR